MTYEKVNHDFDKLPKSVKESLKYLNKFSKLLSTPASKTVGKIQMDNYIRNEKLFYKMISLLNATSFKSLSEKTKYKIAVHFKQSYCYGYDDLNFYLNNPTYENLNKIRNVYSTQKDRTRKKYLNLMNKK